MNACTLWPDRWGSYDLTAACLAHDEDYAAQAGFWASNWRLFGNVRQTSLILALVMLAGTTLLGWAWYLR